jgi:starch synthase
MNIAILTNEYPPNIYGGAGVHVDYLVRNLSGLEGHSHGIHVLCFGNQGVHDGNLHVRGVDPVLQYTSRELKYPSLVRTLIREISMAGLLESADIIHCHTWYTHLAGCLLKQLVGGRLILTTHSLEPHRPWKVEQLGAAYNASSWMEKTAYENADGVVAVSQSMRNSVRRLYGVPDEKIRVIHNGIDLAEYQPRVDPEVLTRYSIDPGVPFILFVGRITRQKGIFHLLSAIPRIQPGVQVVLCAGAADTKELEKEMSGAVEQARQKTGNKIILIPGTVRRHEIITLYSAATLFVCPSIYEPFGIINLEAMACGTPVVASAVGGIPEIVVHQETGILVPCMLKSESSEPQNPDQFSLDLAAAINALLSSPDKIQSMKIKSRQRVEKYFSWNNIARQTLNFYKELLQRSEPRP